MDRHYIVVDDEELTDAIGKYASWLDDQIEQAAEKVTNLLPEGGRRTK